MVILRDDFKKISGEEMNSLFDQLLKQVEMLSDRMIDKVKVAEIAGMSVSWLDNSDCEKAIKLRDLGIRYGRSQTSPVRYPLSEVIKACRIDERFS